MKKQKRPTGPMYRHEQKFYLCYTDYETISSRIANVMQRDKNVGEDGRYHIRSLYFDTLSDASVRDKIDGVENREKFRVRVYNCSDRVIKLESKLKSGQFVRKQSVGLSTDEYRALLAGEPTFLLYKKRPAAYRAYLAMRGEQLRPSVVVDYIREPYTFPVSDVRVTFDMDVRFAPETSDIFDSALPTVAALEAGQVIMEVKFNGFLPDIVHRVIQGGRFERSAISKYVLCRKYE